MLDKKIRLKADYILPILSHPIPNGVITIRDNIVEDVSTFEPSPNNKLRPASEAISETPYDLKVGHDEIIDLGKAVLMPGFINSHTHLELSILKGRLKYRGSFAHWLGDLVEAKSEWGEREYITSTKHGIAELINTGTTTVADITNTGYSVEPTASSHLRGIIYKEVIGLDPERAEDTFKENVEFIESLPRHPLIRYGLSPHAPYSVSGKLLEKIAIYSSNYGTPITIHISESEEEIQFLKEGSSPLREFLKRIGALPCNWQPVGTTPISYLYKLNFLSSNILGVHLNFLSDEDIEILDRINMPIVHCPKSTRYFGRHKSIMDIFPEQFNIAIGTDSLASNESLNMLDEMTLLKKVLNIPADTILKMATINGAKALGLEERIGTLQKGKCADIIALRKVKDPASLPAQKELTESLLKDTWEVFLTIVDGKILRYSH